MHDTTQQELERLRNAIRKHRDQRGDERCWRDNEELYSQLPEGYVPPERDTLVELENCKKFIASCHDPRTSYTSPQLRIQQLESQILQLQQLVQSLASRVAAQSELLGKVAEKNPH